MGRSLKIMAKRAGSADAAWFVLACVAGLASLAKADWNVNVGSNINTAPVVVNDPLLDFGSLYACDYAMHRVVECFYNGTCRDLCRRAAVVSSFPGDSTLDIMITDEGRTRAGMTEINCMWPARVLAVSFCTMPPTASSKSRLLSMFRGLLAQSSTFGNLFM